MLKIFSVACEPSRYNTLEKTIETIYNQVDKIYIYFNEFKEYPKWINKYNEGKIVAINGSEDEYNLTDNGKFYALKLIKTPCYFFTGDSDLLYPNNYIEYTKEQIKIFGCIISYHGRILKDRDKYYDSDHEAVHFWQPIKYPKRLDVGGTGVMAFRTDYFNPTEVYKSEYKRMSDLVLSLEAWKQNKMIVSPVKPLDYIYEQEVNSSIFMEESKGSQEKQVYLMKEILKCKNSYQTTMI